MSKTVRFIHCADLHLGSPLKTAGNMSRRLQQILEQASYSAAEKIADTAIDCEVDFVLFCGDIYDRDTRSVKANSFFAGQLRRLEDKGIPVFIVYGNHDPLENSRDVFPLPGNVTVFPHDQSSCFTVRDKSGSPVARIFGQSYRNSSESRKLHANYSPPDSSILNIAMLHTGLDPGTNPYVPCSLEELRGIPNVHYWALGHIHKPIVYSGTVPAAAYPGIPQGRDPGEPGAGGCLLVEAGPDAPAKVRFVPLSSIIWLKQTISITPDYPQDITSLEEMLLSQGQEIIEQGPEIFYPEIEVIPGARVQPAGYIVRWEITGRGILHKIIENSDRDELTELLSNRLQQTLGSEDPFLWTESLRFSTASPVPDLAALAARDEIFRVIMEKRRELSQEPELRKRLLSSLGSVFYEQKDPEDVREDSIPLTQERLESLLDRGQDLVIDRLIRERERFDY